MHHTLATTLALAAATLFVAIPPVTMFFLMQRHFVSGLTMGAVKG